MQVNQVMVRIAADVSDVLAKMREAESSVGGAMSGIERSVSSVKTAVGGLVAGLSVGMFVGMIRGAIDAMDSLNDLSKTTGISVEKLAGLKLAAKQSGGDLDSIAASVNKLSVAIGKDSERFAKLGVTAKEPLEAFKQFSDVFRGIADPQLRAALGAEALGKSWAGAAPLLTEGSAKITEMVDKGMRLSGVTQEMANRADELNDKIAELEAASGGAKMKLAGEMLPALIDITKAVSEAYTESGKLQAIWVAMGALGAFAFTNEFSSAAVKIKDLQFKLDTLEGRRVSASKGLIDTLLFGSVNDLTGKIEGVKAQIKSLQDLQNKPAQDAAAKAASAEELQRQKAKADAAREFLKLNDEARKKAAAAAEAAAKAHDSFVRGIEKELDVMRLGTVEAKLHEAALLGIKGQKLADLELTLRRIDAMKEGAKSAQAHADARKKEAEGIAAFEQAQTDAYNAAVKGSKDALAAAQAEYEQYGLSKSQIAELTLLTLQSTQAKLRDGTEGYKALQLQIEAQQQLIAILKNGEVRAANDQAAKEVVEEWKKTSEQINGTLTDALMRGFESGKDFARNMRDTIVNMFKTLVLRPIISAIVNPVAQGMTGMLGLGGAANAATGGGDLSTAAAAASIFGAGGLGGALAGGAGWLTGATTFGGALSAGASLIGTGTVAGAASGAGMIVGALGPIALGIGALVAIAKATKGETRSGGQYSYSAATGTMFAQGPSGGQIAGTEVQAAITGTVDSINKLLRNAGSVASVVGFQAGLESSDKGRGGVFSGGTLSTGATFGESGKGSNYDGTLYEKTSATSLDSKAALENFTTDLVQGSLQALQAAADIPKSIADMLKGVDTEALSADAANKLLTSIDGVVTGVSTLRDALATMGLKELSFDAAAGLIAAAGGMDKLGTSLGTYYDKFYSAEEKATASLKATQAAFAKLGVTMPTATDGLRDWYRAQVDSLMAMDQTVAANAQATAGALALANAVDQIAPATDGAVSGMQGFVDNVMQMVNGIHTSVSGSIFDMQYGLQDNQGKYGMLDTVAKGYDDQMRGATDINVIADMAQREIDTINKAWALLDATQQQSKLGEMTALLNKVDTFVTQSGADAISLKAADNKQLADAVAVAVEKALQTLTQRLADAAITQAAATSQLAEAKREPTQLTVTVNNSTGSEVSISS